MLTPKTLLFVLLAVPALGGQALCVEGDWLTDPDAALEQATQSKRPILAVAMDHG